MIIEKSEHSVSISAFINPQKIKGKTAHKYKTEILIKVKVNINNQAAILEIKMHLVKIKTQYSYYIMVSRMHLALEGDYKDNVIEEVFGALTVESSQVKKPL